MFLEILENLGAKIFCSNKSKQNWERRGKKGSINKTYNDLDYGIKFISSETIRGTFYLSLKVN